MDEQQWEARNAIGEIIQCRPHQPQVKEEGGGML